MRVTRLILALPVVLTLSLAGCQSDLITGPAGDDLHAGSGPLSPANDECDPHNLPC